MLAGAGKGAFDSSGRSTASHHTHASTILSVSYKSNIYRKESLTPGAALLAGLGGPQGAAQAGSWRPQQARDQGHRLQAEQAACLGTTPGHAGNKLARLPLTKKHQPYMHAVRMHAGACCLLPCTTC